MDTITIGNQIWMSKNLCVGSFINGEPIQEANTNAEWLDATQNKIPACCYYENDVNKKEKYGRLYNFYSVIDKRGLAPLGWHIPGKGEFEELRSTVNYDGNILKRIGEGKGSGAGRSVNGFNALLGGFRDGGGNFNELGKKAYFWSSTKNDSGICYLHLIGDHNGIGIGFGVEYYAFSVRLIKD